MWHSAIWLKCVQQWLEAILHDKTPLYKHVNVMFFVRAYWWNLCHNNAVTTRLKLQNTFNGIKYFFIKLSLLETIAVWHRRYAADMLILYRLYYNKETVSHRNSFAVFLYNSPLKHLHAPMQMKVPWLLLYPSVIWGR